MVVIAWFGVGCWLLLIALRLAGDVRGLCCLFTCRFVAVFSGLCCCCPVAVALCACLLYFDLGGLAMLLA